MEFPAHALSAVISDARELGFKELVITGGEPSIHSDIRTIYSALQSVRKKIKPLVLVLRTNFQKDFERDELAGMAGAFDRIVVSIDGDRDFHDARRGPGTYDAAVRNMRRYRDMTGSMSNIAKLSISASLRTDYILGGQGRAVQELGAKLGLEHVSFRPLLPLGRARDYQLAPSSEALYAYKDPLELIENGFYPPRTCGMGQNLYVEPSGESFPCYAYHIPDSSLGNILEIGLKGVINAEAFAALTRHTVDTNPVCSSCDVRYLCGGLCRAWGGNAPESGLDAPPADCENLKKRAANLVREAMRYLEIEPDEGGGAGV